MFTRERTTNSSVEAAYDDYLMPIWRSLNVPVERAPGRIFEDFDGNEYLNVSSGTSATNVGYNNKAAVEAATEQSEGFVHGCSYVHPNRSVADLAETIAEVTPGDLQKTFFCNPGTEAVEGAIKLARKYTGSKEVISLEMGLHGRTLGSLAFIGNKAYEQDMAPTINDVAHTTPPCAYRRLRRDGGICGADCADALERVIGSHTSGDLAAVIAESVMGEAGIVVPSEAWFKRVRDIAHDHGALLIADEVQTGYGRTGELFASKQLSTEPDIPTQVKGIANGLPLGVFTAPADIADALGSGDHLSTSGGNPVICAVALATIEELQNGIVDNACENGEWLSVELATLESDYDVAGEARGLELMQGIELMDPETTGPQHAALAPGKGLAVAVGEHPREGSNVVMGVDGYCKNVMCFQSPLTISQAQLGEAVDALRTALNDLA